MTGTIAVADSPIHDPPPTPIDLLGDRVAREQADRTAGIGERHRVSG